MAKAPTISAGPASSNDFYTTTEDQLASGELFFNVRTNDAKNTTLYSIDNGNVADLLAQDQVLVSEQSQLGNSIRITADGRIGYSQGLSGPQIQSLAAGEVMEDSFLYAIRQGNGSLLWQTVRVTITGTNDAPVARLDSSLVSEDVLSTGSVAGNDTDVDHGAVLRFAATGQLAGFAMASDGSWAFDGSDPAYQSLRAGQTVELVVGYTVTDEHGASSSSFLRLTLTGTNDAAVVTGAVTGAASEDGTGSTLNALANASDMDEGASLSVVDVPATLPPGVSYDAATKSFTLDPAHIDYQSLGEGETTTVVVGYGVSDGTATSAASVSWMVTGTNDGPVAEAATAIVDEDGAVGGTLVAADPDANANLIFEPYYGAPDGVSINADGSWSFDANLAEYQSLAEGESRDVVIDYVVTDDGGETSVSTLTVTVNGTNDAPVTTSQWAEATEGQVADGSLLAFDQDNGAALSFAVVGEAPAGFALNADGGWTFDGANAAYNELDHGEVRLIEVPFSVTDEHGAATSSFMIIALTGTNDVPVRSGPAYAIPDQVEDQPFTLTAEQLLQGWTDADGDTVQVASIQGSDGGVFADNGDGTYTFDPATNETGTVNLHYSVTDGTVVRSTFLQFFITGVNDPARIYGPTVGLVTEDAGSGSSISGDLEASDDDNPYDSWTVVSSATASASGYGTYVVDAAGRWTYTLDNGNAAVNALATGETLTDSFVLSTIDGTEQAITITIRGATDFAYTSPPISTAPDANDFDALHAELAKTSTQFNFNGTASGETVEGSNNNDGLHGHGGDDVMYGHNGNDTIYGDNRPGSQPLVGVAGNDTLYGQAGADTMTGGVGNDTLYGGSGADTLNGGFSEANPDSGADTLYGGSGDDRLYGNAGDDVLVGGTGFDWLTGGSGSDRFVFEKATDTGDWVFDFERGSDLIDLSALGLDPANFLGALPAAGMVGPGQVGYMTVQGQGQMETYLYIDTDGQMGADLEIRLVGTSQFASSDIAW